MGKLVESISWDSFQRYFDQLGLARSESDWPLLNRDAMIELLDAPYNLGLNAFVMEDFRKINDLCLERMNLLPDAHGRYGIPFPSDENDLQVSMNLYLNHREAFDFAWSRYLLYSSPSLLTFYHLESGPFDIDDEKITLLQADLKEWFGRQGKGDVCEVKHFKGDGEHEFLVARGTQLRTIAHWKGMKMEFTRFCPAREDVFQYVPSMSRLTVQASVQNEREEYLRAFSDCVAQQPELFDSALESHMFSLVPFQDSTFDFGGDDAIESVTMTEVAIKLDDEESSVFVVKSSDVVKSLKGRHRGISLKSGDLIWTNLRFDFRSPKGKPEQVTVSIRPPARTDIVQKRFAGAIDAYLRKQGVIQS